MKELVGTRRGNAADANAMRQRPAVGALFAATLACSAPEAQTLGLAEPGGASRDELSVEGLDRLIPIRFVQFKQSLANPDYVTLDQVMRSINAANYVYRDAGVQFYAKSIESYASNFGTNPPAGFYNIWVPPVTPSDPMPDYEPYRFRWDQVRSSLMAALPAMPSNAYLNSDRTRIDFWLGIASSTQYATSEELLMWVVGTAGGCWSGFPWNGKGIVMQSGCFNEHTFPHEIGHTLGLIHTFDTPSGTPGGIPDPETGGTLVLEDSWDLIHGAGGPGIPPTVFSSKSAALAYGSAKYLNNDPIPSGTTLLENCTVGAAPDCSVSCQLHFQNGGDTRAFYTNGQGIDYSLRFLHEARGTNVMTYLPSACKDNAITPSQAALVRKYLKYDLVQSVLLGGVGFIGSPNHLERDRFGFRRAEPAFKLDFDGDGKREVGVFKPPTTVGGTGSFEILTSSTNWVAGLGMFRSFGTLGDIPVPADYDGDGRTDIAVYRTSGPSGTDPTDGNGYWVYCPSNGGLSNCTSPVTISAGNREDIPIPGTDFDGNPATGEMAYYRPSNDRLYWRIQPYTSFQSRSLFDSPGASVFAMQLDSDNKTDIVRYDASNPSFAYRLSTQDWNTHVIRSFAGAARGSYPVRRTKAGKDIFSIYDPTTATFHTYPLPLSPGNPVLCQYGNPGDTAIGATLNLNPSTDQLSELLLLQKPNAAGDLVFKVRNSGGTCAGDAAIQTIGPAASNRVVLFNGQDMSGDGKPDLMMLNLHTMEWRFYHSQFHPATWSFSSAFWGDSRDVPL